MVISFQNLMVLSSSTTITSSPGGLEANSLFLQGTTTVSRNYSVGVTQPTLAGNAGDVVFNANPTKGGYVGWVYTTDNNWFRFGNVSVLRQNLLESLIESALAPQHLVDVS